MQLIKRIGMLLGGTNQTVHRQAIEIFEFEKSLVELFEKKSDEYSAEQTYKKMSVAELQQLCPAVSSIFFVF